jgi:hypothetical protein
MAISADHKFYSITIFGYKKEGMSEKEYHDYISNTHAGHLKALLAKNDIVSYTMVSTICLPYYPAPISASLVQLLSCRRIRG